MASRILRPLIGRQHTLGHEDIDSELTTIANWWLRVVECEPIQFPFFIARLAKLMRNHFDHEAELMERAGGALCECHRREHRMILALCEQANALSTQDCRKAQSLLRNQLPGLVRDHIDCTDQLVVMFINTNGEIAQAR